MLINRQNTCNSFVPLPTETMTNEDVYLYVVRLNNVELYYLIQQINNFKNISDINVEIVTVKSITKNLRTAQPENI